MAKRAKPEEIIWKLRDVEVRLSRGETTGHPLLQRHEYPVRPQQILRHCVILQKFIENFIGYFRRFRHLGHASPLSSLACRRPPLTQIPDTPLGSPLIEHARVTHQICDAQVILKASVPLSR